jgi:ankyrin repeat protein
LIRDLEPRVQTFVVKTLFQLDDASRQFSLAAFLLNGYGVPSDDERGLHFLNEAARAGHSIAQAYLYRMFAACLKEVPSQVPVLQYLKDQALKGSRMALVDLKKLDPIQAVQIRELMKFGYAGVGADWYYDNQWLYGLTQSKLMSKDFSPERLGSKRELPDIIANKRGDRLLHAAAAVGAFGFLQILVTDFKFDVNQQNAKGETALLCACRSGHPDIVKFLLDSGARASIQSTDGESPLHWLTSFDEKINVAALGKDLIERGNARVEAFTTRRISHSMFPGSIDVDFQVEGTPLMWAVHNDQPRVVSFLLSMGADPNWRLVNGGIPPIEWASFFHHTECLKLMIEHLENTADVPTTTDGKRDVRHAVVYGPLVAKAIHASDKFSMIVRNGVNYITQLRSTLALLQEKTKLVRFSLGRNQTPLHYACRGAHDEACKIILELDWLTGDINTPAGLSEKTPLLESVRWNRRGLFQLLRRHGAEVHALCPSPFDERGQRTWSALHVLADQAHDNDVSLVDDLIAAGVPVDGDPATETETPFHIAVRRNAFCLADMLRGHRANPDALRTRSALLVAQHPLTTLGHAIARNSRHGLPALRYLLALQPRLAFVVEPSRGLTALHLASLVPDGFAYVGGGELERVDFDWETNGTIVHELLTCFCDRDELNARCLQGKTALHLAAEGGNAGVVEELVRAGADVNLRCETGQTAADVARRVWGQQDSVETLRKLLGWLEK